MIVRSERHYRNVFLISEAFLPLFLGGMIYVIFRTDSLNMFGWFEQLHISDLVYKIRNSVHFSHSELNKTIINTAPGGFWTFSYSAFLLFIWKLEINSKNIFYFIFIPVMAIISEFFQLTCVISGTFDYSDIISYAMGALLPFLIHFKKLKINFR